MASDTRDPGRPADFTSAPFAFHVVDTSPPGRDTACARVIGALPAARTMGDATAGAATAIPAGATSRAAAATAEPARLTTPALLDRCIKFERIKRMIGSLNCSVPLQRDTAKDQASGQPGPGSLTGNLTGISG
jgi:hypothetical protein